MAAFCPSGVFSLSSSVSSQRRVEPLRVGLPAYGRGRRRVKVVGPAASQAAGASSGGGAPSSPSRRELLLAAMRRGDIPPILQFSPDDFSVDRLLGTLDFMNVAAAASSSASPPFPTSLPSTLGNPASSRDDVSAGLSADDVSRMVAGGREVGRGGLQIRLYRGRLVLPGARSGTRVLLKVYPSRGASTSPTDADALAANELGTHVLLQQILDEEDEEGGPMEGFENGIAACECENIAVLLGGFETASGEKWLVLRDDGFVTAADYASQAAQATAAGRAVGSGDLWDLLDRRRTLARRKAFLRRVARGLFRGLSFLHCRGRLHQSLGPASLTLNTTDELAVDYVVPRLRDFAFSVDISDPSSLTRAAFPSGVLEEAASSLWRRAAQAGAKSTLLRKGYGLADDMYAAGLTFAYLAFIPLCQPDAIDGPALQRLLETTFRLDVKAAREYCREEERWQHAVDFLDERDGAGWDLLQALLNPDYRRRPSAAAVLLHPFLADTWSPPPPPAKPVEWLD